jgi:PST family polysaccharide transporter
MFNMSLTGKIAKNIFWQILGRGIGLFLSLISLGLITRYLGLTGFGNYVTIFIFLQLFSILADLGLTLMSVQLISEIVEEDEVARQKKTDDIFSNIFTLRLVSVFILLCIAPIVVWFFPYPLQVKYGVLICSAGFLFISLVQILQSVFQKNLEMSKPAVSNVLSKLSFLVGVYLVTIKDWNLYGVLAFLVLSHLVHFVLLFYWSRKFVKVRFLIQLSVWKEIFKRSWPLSLSIIFNLVYLKADILILSLYDKQDVVGVYGAAYRAIDVLTVFPYLFVGLILPILSLAWAENNKERFMAILQKGFDALATIAVPLVVGVIFLSKPIMVLIAGQEFEISGSVLRILIIALGMIYLGNIFGHSVVAINKQKEMIWGYLFAAVTSLIGYFIFIPRYSYWGAVGVTLYSETLITLLTLIMVSKTVKRWPKFNILFKSIIASGVMALFLYFMSWWNLFIIIPAAVFVYFGVMLVIGGVRVGLVKEILNFRG